MEENPDVDPYICRQLNLFQGQYFSDVFLRLDRPELASALVRAEMARLRKVEIYAYCLMDNHYHLLLSTPTGGFAAADAPSRWDLYAEV